MEKSDLPDNPHLAKGCLGLTLLGLFSIVAAAALVYVAQRLIGY